MGAPLFSQNTLAAQSACDPVPCQCRMSLKKPLLQIFAFVSTVLQARVHPHDLRSGVNQFMCAMIDFVLQQNDFFLKGSHGVFFSSSLGVFPGEFFLSPDNQSRESAFRHRRQLQAVEQSARLQIS